VINVDVVTTYYRLLIAITMSFTITNSLISLHTYLWV